MKRILWAASMTLALNGASAMSVSRGDGGGLRMPSAAWEVAIDGEIVSGTLTMSFLVTDAGSHAGEVRFPLPKGAVLRGAEVWLPAAQRWENAETAGRKQAQTAYTEAVQSNDVADPLLVQQIGADAYRALIYPVTSNEIVKMRIRYAHFLEVQDDARLLRIAIENDDVTIAQAGSVSVHVTTQAGAWSLAEWDTTTAAQSASFDLLGGTGSADLRNPSLDHDVTLRLTPASALPEASSYSYLSTNELVAPQLVARWAPNLSKVPGASPVARRVVFVVDVSGSMEGAKLEQTKLAVENALNSLEVGDLFAIVAFSSTVIQESTVLHAVSARPGAILYLRRLAAGTGTNISGGLAAAAEFAPSVDGILDIVLLTDGRPTEGASSATGIVRAATEAAGDGHIRITTFGIGRDLDQTMLNQIASLTAGEAGFALDEEAINGHFMELFERVRGGGLSSAVTQLWVDGVARESTSPRHMLPGELLVIGTQGVAPESVSVSLDATAASGRINVTTGALTTEKPTGTARLVIPALLAKAQANALEREADATSETSTLLHAAVVLAKQYGIVTRYSALIAFDNPSQYSTRGIARMDRDEAGIALTTPTPSTDDESRIGGEGVLFYDGQTQYGYSEYPPACYCLAAHTNGPYTAALLLLVLVTRRRKTSIV